MSQITRSALIPALVAGWLMAADSARALTPQVKDDAELFKKEAVTKANEIIQDIQLRYKKDLLIETFKTVPAGKEELVKGRDKAAKARFYSDWARQQAKAANVQGIYVLISKSPGHVEVAIGNQTQRDHSFSDGDGRELRDLIARK